MEIGTLQWTISPVSLSQPFNFQLTVKKQLQNSAALRSVYANKQQAWLFVWLGTSVWLTTHKHLQMGPFPGGISVARRERRRGRKRGHRGDDDCRAAEVLEPHKMLQMLSQIMMKGYNYRDSNVILDLFVPTSLLASWMELVCVCFEHLLLVAILLSIADAYTHTTNKRG